MAPKKQKQAASKPKAGESKGQVALEKTSVKNVSTQEPDSDLAQYTKSFFLLTTLAVASCVSQAALSPVFGSIPSSTWHAYIINTGLFLGWSGNGFFKHVIPVGKTSDVLPVLAFYIPVVQFFLYPFSEQLGNPLGPLVIEALTLLPLTIFSAASIADFLEDVKIPFPQFVADAAPGMGSWSVFQLLKIVFGGHLGLLAGKGFFYTRVGLELVVGGLYALFSPSKYVLLALPALLHTAVWNTHVMTPAATARLNSTLLADQWVLLERKESVTGYVSVMESVEQGFRVMRCDHSLLGGQWVKLKGITVPEPIYGVFVMLEAVRLVESETKVADKDANALVIGLGIGTTPSALVSHGIDTTVVEIDPAVHDLAVKYFDLKENREPVLKNAVKYTASLVEQGTYSYDYIVHDVFTGGAEPVDLFTLEFLEGLSKLLKPDGVIAINYAGDFNLPAPQVVVKTITSVFPTCRFFRESDEKETAESQDGSDFTNLVIFCQKTSGPLTFRKPVQADFLQSWARHAFLEPKNEVQQAKLLGDEKTKILRKNNTDMMAPWQRSSAAGHWTIMRTVIPAKVWELW